MKISSSLKSPFIIFSIILFGGLLYTFFYPIPTDSYFERVGIGANMLDIADRQFYINFGTFNYGYGDIKGGSLYPFILRMISKFTSIFNYGETSLLWNFLVISITSIISLLNLVLLDLSTKNIFGTKIAKIANWLYIACPYTLFYALSGGLTTYIIFGTTLTTFLITSSSVFRKNGSGISYQKTNFYLFFCTIYLSLLRPTGLIYSLVLVFLFNIYCFIKINSGNIVVLRNQKKVGLIFFGLSVLFCIQQLILYFPYISFSINMFTNENGYFYGVVTC